MFPWLANTRERVQSQHASAKKKKKKNCSLDTELDEFLMVFVLFLLFLLLNLLLLLLVNTDAVCLTSLYLYTRFYKQTRAYDERTGTERGDREMGKRRLREIERQH